MSETPTLPTNDWIEYRNLVIKELDRLHRSIEDTNRKIEQIREQDIPDINTELRMARENIISLTKTVRDGNGQQSLVSKVAILEAVQDRMHRWIEEEKTRQQESRNYRLQITIAMVGSTLALLASVLQVILSK